MTPKSLSGIRYIYFDLDDTLCGYWDASKAGLKAAFEKNPVPGNSSSDAILAWGRAFKAFSKTIKTGGWYPQYLQNGAITRTEQMRLTLLEMGVEDQSLAEKLGDDYGFERDAHLVLFPDAFEVLTELKPHFGLGLCTNGPADIQRQEIETCGIESFFDDIFIEGEMKEGKPVKSVFERLIAATKVTPSEIVFVGNSYHHDIVPSIEHGIRTVWIRRPSDVPPSAEPNSGPEEKPQDGPNPDFIIAELSELLPILMPVHA